MCVSGARPFTSPIGVEPAAVDARRAQALVDLDRATPARGRPSPARGRPVVGLRPTPTSSSSPSSSRPSSSRSVTRRRPSRETPPRAPRRAPRSPRPRTPARTSSPANGSSRASRRGAPSTMVTSSLPRRRYACASSTPTAPPPRTRRRRGTRMRLRRLAVRPTPSRPRAPGSAAAAAPVPVARTTACRASSAGSRRSVLHVDARSPASRPWPRTSVAPISSSQRSWPSSLQLRSHVVALREAALGVDAAVDRLGAPGTRGRGGEHVAGAEERLPRDAAPVRALAADELLLDERDGEAALGAAARRRSSPAGPPPTTMTSKSAHPHPWRGRRGGGAPPVRLGPPRFGVRPSARTSPRRGARETQRRKEGAS